MSRNVIIVGAGVIGLAVADELVRLGCEVTVLDAGEPGQASWAASGALSLIMPQLAPPALRVLAAHSVARWPAFAERLEQRAGMSIQRQSTGLLRLVMSPDTASSVAATNEWLTGAGVPCETLDRAQIQSLAPLANPAVQTALYQPELWRLRPPRLLAALKTSLSTHPAATIALRCRVTGLLQAAGKIQGVELSTGDRLHADEVIVCAGAWSSHLLQSLIGRPLPVHPVRGQMVCLEGSELAGKVGGPALLGEANAYVIPRRGARIVAGSTFEEVGFDSRVTANGVQRILHEVTRIAPGLGDAPIDTMWAGLRPASRDGLPFIGRIEGVDGLIIATGHFRDGILLTPITAGIVASLVQRRAPELDIEPFLPYRHVDEPSAGDQYRWAPRRQPT